MCVQQAGFKRARSVTSKSLTRRDIGDCGVVKMTIMGILGGHEDMKWLELVIDGM